MVDAAPTMAVVTATMAIVVAEMDADVDEATTIGLCVRSVDA